MFIMLRLLLNLHWCRIVSQVLRVKASKKPLLGIYLSLTTDFPIVFAVTAISSVCHLQGMVKVRALYDFAPQERNELPLVKNQVIIVTDQSDKNWWRGHLENDPKKEGLFPVPYIEVMHP